ncbi:MAG: HvfC/BufC family peptide modification chaperone [Alphaproteobacteria bacterium]
MSLGDFQNKFKDTMFCPVSDIGVSEKYFSNIFIDNEISLNDRMKVYHNNVVGSLTEVLRATFPLLENLVGEDFLKSMARAFIFDNPPSSGCMHMYGAGFDEFIKTYKPANNLPYLADIATLELALNNAYYAPDDNSLGSDDLSKVPPDLLSEVLLNLHSSASLISSLYPLEEIRSFCLGEAESAAPDLSVTHKCRILVVRQDLEVIIVSLPDDEYEMLRLLNDKVPLGDTVEGVLSIFPEFDFTTFLQKHVTLGSLSSI